MDYFPSHKNTKKVQLAKKKKTKPKPIIKLSEKEGCKTKYSLIIF